MRKILLTACALCLLATIAAVGVSALPKSIVTNDCSSVSYFFGAVTLDVSAAASTGGRCEGKLCLFGLLPIRTVSVTVSERVSLAPCGRPFGIKVFSDGVLVVRFGEVYAGGRSFSPAQDGGIRLGDIIDTINGEAVTTNRQVAGIVSNSGGRPLEIALTRGGESMTLHITPALTDGGYMLGMWVRDSVVGIGTLTYVDTENGVAAGLGHPISDFETGVAIPVLDGELVRAEILGLKKSVSGSPGSLEGRFQGGAFARLLHNGQTGVYGELFGNIDAYKPLPIAFRHEIKRGEAYIYTVANGTQPKKYAVEIERIYLLDGSPTKNMIVRVTDRELLATAGGIVQGMSGSPIIQNGRIVGAVTHVFVNDPTRGYAIFIENMLSTQYALETENLFDNAA